MKIDLSNRWFVLQDVSDSVEKIGIESISGNNTVLASQISEWEPIERLEHLQLLFAANPYYGRELRHFNSAPWWYKRTFSLGQMPKYAYLTFTNVDYYCRVYLNGRLVGDHEGYSDSFSLSVADWLQLGENILLVKVWSPWDEEVEGDRFDQRTIMVRRRMVKGTYEHSDGFIQRDVNPIGIYGDVFLHVYDDAHFFNRVKIDYTLNEACDKASVRVKCGVQGFGAGCLLRVRCTDVTKGTVLCEEESGKESMDFTIKDFRLWNTWDRGGSSLYRFAVSLVRDGVVLDERDVTTGFRRTQLRRDKNETVFVLNNRKMFVRGASYFPDQYISAMNLSRYKNDLLKLKAAGFNFIRVHVHVEKQEFYELCDELGIGIMQDSEFNWVHPFDSEFTKRFIDVFTHNIEQLSSHPSIMVWSALNEPGMMDLCRMEDFHGFSEYSLEDTEDNDPYADARDRIINADIGAGREKCAAMESFPGPQIYEAIIRADASRPAIKGSFCRDDPCSGDSHNYCGSLSGEKTHYLDTYNSREKLNTEYGFDAPPAYELLEKSDLRIAKRLAPLRGEIAQIQEYQYKYLKYMTEHYRMQKNAPCAGYMQFMFSDVSPSSFYGLYDYCGLPKRGLDAMLESNAPLAIMLRFGRERIDGVYVVNDLPSDVGVCRALLTIKRGEQTKTLSANVDIKADSIVRAFDIVEEYHTDAPTEVWLVLSRDDEVLAKNHYEDVFRQPRHPHGHPGRISHELGCRIYGE